MQHNPREVVQSRARHHENLCLRGGAHLVLRLRTLVSLDHDAGLPEKLARSQHEHLQRRAAHAPALHQLHLPRAHEAQPGHRRVLMEDHRAVLVAPQLHLVGQLYQLRKVHALAETQSTQEDHHAHSLAERAVPSLVAHHDVVVVLPRYHHELRILSSNARRRPRLVHHQRHFPEGSPGRHLVHHLPKGLCTHAWQVHVHALGLRSGVVQLVDGNFAGEEDVERVPRHSLEEECPPSIQRSVGGHATEPVQGVRIHRVQKRRLGDGARHVAHIATGALLRRQEQQAAEPFWLRHHRVLGDELGEVLLGQHQQVRGLGGDDGGVARHRVGQGLLPEGVPHAQTGHQLAKALLEVDHVPLSRF
mmetsp:Transcript_48356/g.92512  ORF Transcript_48356/g.92512 Transcript_48356/m.92512 type:complete len:361 (-) Transcript_48356:237-1319(-)